MAERSNVIVQVVRTAIGAHDGVNGSFVIAEFADTASVVYLETALTGIIVERPDEVAAVKVSYEGLKAEALPRAATAELIKEVGKSWT
jgi:hypothetical protein